MKLKPIHYFLIFTTVLIGVLIFIRFQNSSQTSTGNYDTLAQCIADSGATFYGAFWCPHCAEQKKEFGKSESLLPYVECSTPDKKGQTKECIDANITGYPTWELQDGTRLSGTQTLKHLA